MIGFNQPTRNSLPWTKTSGETHTNPQTLVHMLISHALPQVAREDHFAAVKNAPGSATDSPDTARSALLAQGARWVAAAGGQLGPGCEGVEVSPLVSYAGEGLQQLVQGATLQVRLDAMRCADTFRIGYGSCKAAVPSMPETWPWKPRHSQRHCV